MTSLLVIQFFFISILGTLLHFAYDWSNHYFIFSIIGAVNESTWEHLKMGIFPFFFWFIFRSLFFQMSNNFFGNFLALSYFILSISTIFYSYKHFTKKAILPVDISNFYQGVFFGSLIENKIIGLSFPRYINFFGGIGTLVILILCLKCTYYPFEFFLMQDPITKLHGIKGHSKCKIKKKLIN